MVETLADLGVYTSCHGVNHIVTSEKLWMKLMWLGIVVSMFGIVIIHTVQFVNQYNANPVLVQSQINHDKLKFPAVTFCNLNAVRKSQVNKVPALKNLFSLCDIKLDSMKKEDKTAAATTQSSVDAKKDSSGAALSPICQKYVQKMKEDQVKLLEQKIGST